MTLPFLDMFSTSKLLLAGLLACAVWLAWHTIQTQRTEIGALNEKVSRTNYELLASKELLDRKDREITELSLRLKSTEKTRTTLQNSLSDRTAKMKALEKSNVEYKTWADQPLPDAACRLLESDAIRPTSESRPLSGCGRSGSAGSPPTATIYKFKR